MKWSHSLPSSVIGKIRSETTKNTKLLTQTPKLLVVAITMLWMIIHCVVISFLSHSIHSFAACFFSYFLGGPFLLHGSCLAALLFLLMISCLSKQHQFVVSKEKEFRDAYNGYSPFVWSFLPWAGIGDDEPCCRCNGNSWMSVPGILRHLSLNCRYPMVWNYYCSSMNTTTKRLSTRAPTVGSVVPKSLCHRKSALCSHRNRQKDLSEVGLVYPWRTIKDEP